MAKNVLAPLGITAAASTTDAEIRKKTHDSGTKTLIISSKEMNDITKIVQALEDFNILLEGVTKTMLLGTLGVTSLRDMLSGKEMLRGDYENEEGKKILIAGYRNKKSWIKNFHFNHQKVSKYHEHDSRLCLYIVLRFF